MHCCQVTLPQRKAEIRAAPFELHKVKDFLYHYGNGSLDHISEQLAPGCLLLEPLCARPSSVLCGLDAIKYHRAYESSMPSDLTFNITSIITEHTSNDERHCYVRFLVSNPYTAVWDAVSRFISTNVLALREQDGHGLIRFSFDPDGRISEVAVLKQPHVNLSSSNRHVDSYNLTSLSDAGTKDPALQLLEQM